MPRLAKRIPTRVMIDVLVLVISLAMIGIGIAIGFFPNDKLNPLSQLDHLDPHNSSRIT
jgi:hypothetical protein